ncbi:hypothetical protein D3C75_1162660 [compost metagenome]
MGLEHFAVGEVGLARGNTGGVGQYIALRIKPEQVAAYRHGEGLVEQDFLPQGW